MNSAPHSAKRWKESHWFGVQDKAGVVVHKLVDSLFTNFIQANFLKLCSFLQVAELQNSFKTFCFKPTQVLQLYPSNRHSQNEPGGLELNVLPFSFPKGWKNSWNYLKALYPGTRCPFPEVLRQFCSQLHGRWQRLILCWPLVSVTCEFSWVICRRLCDVSQNTKTASWFVCRIGRL